MLVRKYDNKDINSMVTIWNEVVENGVAFPQEDADISAMPVTP